MFGVGRSRWIAVLLLLAGVMVAAYVLLPQYTPDGRHYTATTLEYLGHSPSEARAQASAWFDAHGVSEQTNVPPDFIADLYASRVLYPLLSAPFVALLGIRGMLVVPLLSLVAFVLLMTWLLARLHADVVAVVVVGLTVLGGNFLLYTTAALTDGLALALMAAICCLLPLRPDLPRHAAWWTGLLIVALGFTRQVALVPVAMILAAWLAGALTGRRWRTPWTPHAAGAVAALLISLVWVQLSSGLGPTRSIIVYTHSATLSEAIGKAPGQLRHVATIEIRTLLAERPLLILVIAAVAYAVWRWRTPSAAMIFGGLAATAVLQVVNPYPMYGRIALPLLPVLMIGLAAWITAALPKRQDAPAQDAMPALHPATDDRPAVPLA